MYCINVHRDGHLEMAQMGHDAFGGWDAAVAVESVDTLSGIRSIAECSGPAGRSQFE